MKLIRSIVGLSIGSLAIACDGSTSPVSPSQSAAACPASLVATLAPRPSALSVGDTVRVSFSYTPGCGDSTVYHNAKFSTSNSAVVTIDSTGLITARSAGVATVAGVWINDGSAKAAAILTVH
jgi:hypothetical protein